MSSCSHRVDIMFATLLCNVALKNAHKLSIKIIYDEHGLFYVVWKAKLYTISHKKEICVITDVNIFLKFTSEKQ